MKHKYCLYCMYNRKKKFITSPHLNHLLVLLSLVQVRQSYCILHENYFPSIQSLYLFVPIRTILRCSSHSFTFKAKARHGSPVSLWFKPRIVRGWLHGFEACPGICLSVSQAHPNAQDMFTEPGVSGGVGCCKLTLFLLLHPHLHSFLSPSG
jgi:hypothetical protein